MKLLFFSILIILISISQVHGAAIGVSRAAIRFDDVLKGGYAEDQITVSTDSEEPVRVHWELLEEVGEWTTIQKDGEEISEIIIDRNNPGRITVAIQPPTNIANGAYTGVIRILADNIARTDGQYGSVVVAAFRVREEITVTGRQIQKCTVGGINLLDTEVGEELEFVSTIKNEGNVILTPEYEIDIWDQQETKLLKTIKFAGENKLKPTQIKTVTETTTIDLPVGQYFANLEIKNCGGGRDTFDILDIGQISDKGNLVRLYNQPWAKTNDIIPITADFTNSGFRTVKASLKGTITLDGEVVKVIDTDPINVPAGATVTLETFFQPQITGQYKISVRAHYNNKLTFEQESLLNVNPGGKEKLNTFKITWYPVVIFVLVIIAITLLLMIRKKHAKRPRHKRIKF